MREHDVFFWLPISYPLPQPFFNFDTQPLLEVYFAATRCEINMLYT